MNVLEDLRADDLARRRAAIETLAQADAVSPAHLHALADCLADARKAVQRPAAEVFALLHRRGIDVRGVLDAALASTDGRRRWGAAYALARIGASPTELLPVLLETLAADDGDVRWAAAGILVGLRAPELPERLLDLAGTGNPAQRKMALYCLRDLGTAPPGATAALRGRLADGNPGVRLAAMAAVLRLDGDRAGSAERIVGMLDDADPGVRRAAAATLGRLDVASDAVIAALERARAGSDTSLARTAARALDALRRGVG